jgi:NAD(P)-dependent dehydrogenase (short-subunit alcohol dehydrogenase family)
MRAKLKPIAEQVIVITGASSGIGLAAARLAAKSGAAVVMAAGDEAFLRQASEEIGRAGGRVHPVAGDARTADGCDRIARAATARFGRIDSWIDAGGEAAALPHAVSAVAERLREQSGVGAFVGFGRELAKEVRDELRAARGVLSPTMIRLPKTWSPDSPVEGAAAAALEAVSRPMGRLAVAAKGQGLTLASQARRHRGLLAGVGIVAVAGAALWFGRGRIAEAAKPHVKKAGRTLAVQAVRRRPVQAAKLVARHPRKALKVAAFLR